MNDSLLLIISILFSAAIGAYIGMLITKLKSKGEKSTLEERQNQMSSTIEELKLNLGKIENEREEIRREKEFLNSELTRKNTEYENLQQQNLKRDEELAKQQEQLRKDFELLANNILEKKSEKFTIQNEKNIKELLNPLQDKIKTFEDKVDKTHKESIDYHAALRQQIIGLKELNNQMSKEAINLTRALKGDSKTQGDWGETQLEVLLEKSRLKKGIHFTTQGGFRDEDGRLKKPDFIINLPDNRHLVIDSKVSLTAYEAYYNSEDEIVKSDSLKKHIDSIKKHIRDLGEKKYSALYEINTPDYVLMFVPIENALLIALNENNKLYLEALDKNVVLVSTSTLLATLSTVASIWKQEDQKRNVIEIARLASRLYDQFVNLTNDLLKVGKQLNTVKGSYNDTMKKLTGKGNLITKVEKMRKLGVSSNKYINQELLNRAQDEEE
ncbi:DNA recombination protein RmuC [Pontimicrobium sp. SW4]|uniref:DNA recombination protein RmuC n=1 Tax=Pontimicrobium sp. SW4 TaxID=3153519 RepID=A0AAU7BVY1_9FLAO